VFNKRHICFIFLVISLPWTLHDFSRKQKQDLVVLR